MTAILTSELHEFSQDSTCASQAATASSRSSTGSPGPTGERFTPWRKFHSLCRFIMIYKVLAIVASSTMLCPNWTPSKYTYLWVYPCSAGVSALSFPLESNLFRHR
ncbi:uncharacterized protein EDB93DRAFT_820563 [Suillus bovinus]|uniref:uncharacterized protein n=1 Tax=Suillus bovinus TaxID=48563 RepID=UPI001B85DFC1|nr:uncharacterized protein EDB93DRAFT_820563 [Suillus bovinus]KAG2157852.1 hypothetical protein EDB93DRAFT_820563 [Suillus bovinus]